MKTFVKPLFAALLLAVLSGCGPEKTTETASGTSSAPGAGTPTSSPAASGGTGTTAVVGMPLGSVKAGDKALCAICAVRDGKTEPEEVKATLDYKGKTYAFCSLDEKAEFISNPAKYAGASK